jgi:hypothetical protein
MLNVLCGRKNQFQVSRSLGKDDCDISEQKEVPKDQQKYIFGHYEGRTRDLGVISTTL